MITTTLSQRLDARKWIPDPYRVDIKYSMLSGYLAVVASLLEVEIGAL